MSRRSITLTCRAANSYRVERVLSAMDKTAEEAVRTTIEFDEPPSLDEPWLVGAIVGTSGSGKTTAARTCFPNAIWEPPTWDERAIVDNLAADSFEEASSALVSVGMNAQTRWLRPYSALSQGERFRCDLAQALLTTRGEPTVVDEYAATVDRATRTAASIALRKALDSGRFRKRVVAIAHEWDEVRYLEPDWTLDMRTGTLTRGRLRRGPIRLEARECQRVLWDRFKTFHYLTGSLNRASRCFACVVERFGADDGTDAGTEDDPREPTIAAFAAILQSEGRRGRKRVHRLVVLPEFQGIGIGGAFLDSLGKLCADSGQTLEIVTGAAAFVRRLERSSLWKRTRVYPHGRTQRHKGGQEERGSFGRAIVSFVYQPRPKEFKNQE